MPSIQLLIILFFSAFIGWFIAWLTIKILFWPVKPLHIAGIKLQGMIPAKKSYLADKIGSLIQSGFVSYNGLDEKVSDPALLEKLKPEIENHVDHFLKEKLKTVFPILAQFMGEKTISQFKTAFLDEIDNLFPVLMKNYIAGLKNEIRLDTIISEKINAISMTTLQNSFHTAAKNEIRYFKIACTCAGLLIGIVCITTLLVVMY
jgi:uncharacterized membrane protein YheB (UPF0754 family)